MDGREVLTEAYGEELLYDILKVIKKMSMEVDEGPRVAHP